MKKNGFTLIEIIAVIIVLGVLSIIAVSIIDNAIEDSKEKTYKIQINNIIESAKTWAASNAFNLPNEGESMIITLGELKQAGYAEDDIINPKTKKEFSNNLKIKISVKNNNYQYEVIE